MVTVQVDTGGHGHPVPQGLAKMVEGELQARGVFGEYRLRHGPPERGTPHTPRFKVRGPIGPAGLEILLKPGGNDTVRVCWLAPANSRGLRCEQLREALQAELRRFEPQGTSTSQPEEEEVDWRAAAPAAAPPQPEPPRAPAPSPERPRRVVDLADLERQLVAEVDELEFSIVECEEAAEQKEDDARALREEATRYRRKADAAKEKLAALVPRLEAVRAVAAMVPT